VKRFRRIFVNALALLALALFLLTTAVWVWGGFQRDQRIIIKRSDSSTVMIDLPTGRFPHVLIHLAAPVMLAVMVRSAISRHKRIARRLAAGLCPRCGCDLRGTPRRCPQCGTIQT
jgi:hypothetical protein